MSFSRMTAIIYHGLTTGTKGGSNMTNYQMLKKRYGSWLPSKARIIAAYGAVALSGELKLCNEMDCKNCIFNDPINRACGDITESWLDQEAEI